MKLAAVDLCCLRQGRRVLGPVSLELGKAEIAALLGPNGSGKTTLIRLLAGLLPADGGEVTLDGRPLARWPRRELARHIAYVPQAHSSPFPFSALDIVVGGRSPHLGLLASPGPGEKRLALAAMERLGIETLAARPYPALSGGEKQLVLLARALAQDARFLLLDEPLASLDYGNQIRLLQHLRELADDGYRVFLSSHHPAHARSHADRVLMLKEGGIVGDGPADTVVRADRLAELYGLPPDTALPL